MTRARVLFIFGFLISMAAGFVAGMVVGRTPVHANPATPPGPGPTTNRRPGPPSLDDELGLTTAQRAKVKEIFSAVRPPDGGRNDPLRAIHRERDEAIHQLIPDDRKADYDKILSDCAAREQELRKEHEQQFREAEAKMEAVLTSEQWTKYQDLKKRWHNGRPSTNQGFPGRRGGGGPPPGPPSGPPPTTLPATAAPAAG
jgi:Spy/CpxP family protein refolding chaperone